MMELLSVKALKDRVMKQTVMNRVLNALVPLLIFSIYLFGWRVLAIVFISNLAAFLTEYLFIRNKKNGKVTMAVFVTGTLLALTLPPTIPFWIAAVGSIVAITFGKMVFGGFGLNMFNPAILGRTFVYISFPQQMTIHWLKPYTLSDFPGGLIRWTAAPMMKTGATILSQIRNTGSTEYSINNAFWGTIPGSLGETSAFLIILASIYLIITKTAKWQPMLATTLSLVISGLIFYPQQNPLFSLITGGALFGIVYMTTDPVSQAKGKLAIWIYGILIGFLTVFIRKFSLFYEGMMFAILLVNAFMPMIEYGLDKLQKPKAKAAKV
ncbi:MAG: RnfABCDGE type electron transport complex subunit D [Candidatus Cloacimonadaceae bacterium]